MSSILNLGACTMSRPQFPIFHVLLGLASAQLGLAQVQGDCGNCYHLSPVAIAGVVLGDLLLTLLIAVAVYYVATCLYQRQLASSDHKKPGAPENESPYQELDTRGLELYCDLKNSRSNIK
ncbi:PREDICTED: TYRO protein tyrosine kinase-binding protein [Gekko japonicus]|uniref:TYRO protein tyrosine kinase-binding protein n=1 Tax=Gekko japonicus TaxID=146911 RepID=A0ABM1K299_GEKJA|nr:PREDICTED: TYRO protein tyrosine kinase-binding protein [Gekko japonicus]